MKRLVMASGTVLAMALAVGMQGCGSSDNSGSGSGTPANNGGSGNASSAGAGNATSAGAPGASGAPAGGAGAPAGGAGAPAGGAGAPASGAGAGGAAPSGGGAGGAPASGGGASGAPATAGAGGMSTGTAPTTCVNGEASKAACTTEGSVCGKTCGPDKSLNAYKTETCTAGAIVEGLCTFPTADYTCYKLPAALAACTADAAGPVAGSACAVADCMPCGPAYQDSKMTAKAGACVCTNMKWACASSKEWPPQN